MSYTHEDAQADAHYEKLYNELGPEWAEEHSAELNARAIEAFTNGRLQSYYLDHPDMAKTALAGRGGSGYFRAANGKHLNCRRQRQPWIEFLDEHPWTGK